MFSHLVVKGIDKGEATIVISGDAVFTHAHEMQSALSAALDACQHLIIDVGSVQALDGTFRVLLCSLHRRSELVNKRITVQGPLTGRVDDQIRRSPRVQGCLFKKQDQFCTLWESMVPGRARKAGRAEKAGTAPVAGANLPATRVPGPGQVAKGWSGAPGGNGDN